MVDGSLTSSACAAGNVKNDMPVKTTGASASSRRTMFPPPNISRARKLFFLGRIMSSPDGDGNVRAVVAEPPVWFVRSDRLSRRTKVYVDVLKRSGLDDGEDLSFGNHVVETDQYGFELARGRRSHRNFHLHRFDECNVVAIADAATDFDGKRADAPGHLGHDLDVGHSVLRDSHRAQCNRNARNMKGGRPRLSVVAADCLR